MIEECLLPEFHISGDNCPLATASEAAGVTINASLPLLREDGSALLRFSAEPNDALTETLDNNDRIAYLHRSESDGRVNYRCVSYQPCIVHDLINVGFIVESLTYREGGAFLSGTVVGNDVLRAVLKAASQTVGVRLERVYTLQSKDDTSIAQPWELTSAQEESLRRAFEMGYFEVPREVTAAEVASDLGISTTAFSERLHRAQNSLFSQLFHQNGTGS